MPSDFESGTRKTIDLSIKTEKMTAEVLQNAMQDFLSGKCVKQATQAETA
jgi:hypothetical protein